MPPFIERIGYRDFETNEYYNKLEFVGETGYYKGRQRFYQCVNLAAGRAAEIAETFICYFKHGFVKKEDIKYPMFNRYGYGTAINWWKDTLWPKTTKASEVRVGDIVVYGQGWGFNKETKQYDGHVRVVERISDNILYLAGANEDGKGQIKYGIVQVKADGSGDKLTGLIGYIHNPYITREEKPKEEVDYKKLYIEAKTKLDKIKEML